MINFTAITDKFYLGSTPRNMLDAKRIKEQIGADLVISMQHNVCLNRLDIPQTRLRLFYFRNKIKYLRFEIVEFDEDDLAENLVAATDAAKPYIETAKRIYIHCNQGMERAPSFLATFLVRHGGLESVDAAIALIKEKRSCTPIVNAINTALYGVDN